jgi:hypothetical protein
VDDRGEEGNNTTAHENDKKKNINQDYFIVITVMK